MVCLVSFIVCNSFIFFHMIWTSLVIGQAMDSYWPPVLSNIVNKESDRVYKDFISSLQWFFIVLFLATDSSQKTQHQSTPGQLSCCEHLLKWRWKTSNHALNSTLPSPGSNYVKLTSYDRNVSIWFHEECGVIILSS